MMGMVRPAFATIVPHIRPCPRIILCPRRAARGSAAAPPHRVFVPFSRVLRIYCDHVVVLYLISRMIKTCVN